MVSQVFHNRIAAIAQAKRTAKFKRLCPPAPYRAFKRGLFWYVVEKAKPYEFIGFGRTLTYAIEDARRHLSSPGSPRLSPFRTAE